jgi:hypothetical protein
MATAFVSRTAASLDEWDETEFVRFSGGRRRGVLFEFGTVSNFERVLRLMRRGERFVSLGMSMDVDPKSADDLERLMVDGRVTFGDFPVTVEVGSGEMFRFSVEE